MCNLIQLKTQLAILISESFLCSSDLLDDMASSKKYPNQQTPIFTICLGPTHHTAVASVSVPAWCLVTLVTPLSTPGWATLARPGVRVTLVPVQSGVSTAAAPLENTICTSGPAATCVKLSKV